MKSKKGGREAMRFVFLYHGVPVRVYTTYITLAGTRIPRTILSGELRICVVNEEINHQHDPLIEQVTGASVSQAVSPRRVRKSKQKTPQAHYGITARGHQTRNR